MIQTDVVQTQETKLNMKYNKPAMHNYFDGKKMAAFCSSIWMWLTGLSERTLGLMAIAILHAAFIPTMFAYINGVTEHLPNVDIYLLVLSSLAILALRAIIKKDLVSVFIHNVGFVVQLGLAALIIFK